VITRSANLTPDRVNDGPRAGSARNPFRDLPVPKPPNAPRRGPPAAAVLLRPRSGVLPVPPPSLPPHPGPIDPSPPPPIRGRKATKRRSVIIGHLHHCKHHHLDFFSPLSLYWLYCCPDQLDLIFSGICVFRYSYLTPMGGGQWRMALSAHHVATVASAEVGRGMGNGGAENPHPDDGW